MTTPRGSDNPPSTDGAVSDLVVALNSLRDSLLEVAMAMRDYQFEMDPVQRSRANEAAASVMVRVTAAK